MIGISSHALRLAVGKARRRLGGFPDVASPRSRHPGDDAGSPVWDQSTSEAREMMTLPALEVPRSDAPLAPAAVEAWRAHSAANNASYWELPPRRMGRRWARWDDAWAADPGLANPYPNSATLLRPMTEAAAGE